MKLNFTKMHGCGNDYIYFNCFDKETCDRVSAPVSLAPVLSDRHTGIGGDGIVLIMPSETADAKMLMYNIDGSSAMCGNAIRCVGKYLYDNGIVSKESITIETPSGFKYLTLFTENGLVTSVKVNMGAAILLPKLIPVDLPGENVVAAPVTIGGQEYAITCVSMGNPHAVVFCEGVDELPLHTVGPQFEYNALFPERVNTEFVHVLGRNLLKMRVWERGSGETQACGTGACAVGVASVLNGYCDKDCDITVKLPGGDLIIKYTDEAVFMTGPCIKVFDGVMDLI